MRWKAGELAPCGHIASLFGRDGGAGGAAQETLVRIAAHSAMWSGLRRILPAAIMLITSGSECLQRGHIDSAVARVPDEYAFDRNFLPAVAPGIEDTGTQHLENLDAEGLR